MSDEPPNRPISAEVAAHAGAWATHIPNAEDLVARAAVAAVEAIPEADKPAGPLSLSLVLADDETVRTLNRDYRGADKPTNVLAFAALEGDSPEIPGEPVELGDVVIALETVLAEARAQGKTAADHLTHLTVHGTLHLLGLDHQDDTEAEAMEGLEVRVLAGLGVADPYAEAAGGAL
ncbi:probable rRNA maturation factor [Limimonas halophila]|uniref:Endoribonuclease YbeY n=1 Tax=Limimonas halophila TaxID=1082479 RepID=A0A1G7SK17_9PROT|nr:rRNA maturation RNase YbeY [Limimonas halophila]SDG23395.1 probable rRNA maturation factor [Limimonas halophila]